MASFSVLAAAIFSSCCLSHKSQLVFAAKRESSLTDDNASDFKPEHVVKQMLVNRTRSEEGKPPSELHQYQFEHGKLSMCPDRCVCFDYNKTVNCSNNLGQLTYVPEIPSRYVALFFSNNNLTTIQDRHFFKNASGITNLDISDNQLRFLSPDAFYYLTELRKLHLGKNILTYDNLRTVVFPSGLNQLFLRNMNLSLPPEDFFKTTTMARGVGTLDLGGNLIPHLNLSVFLPLHKLTALKVRGAGVSRLTPTVVPTLTYLALQDNALYHLPYGCTRNSSTPCPRLQNLDLSINKIHSDSLSDDVYFPHLEILSLGYNRILVFEADMFGAHRFPRLQKLYLNGIQPIMRVDKFAFRSPTLVQFTMRYSNLPDTSMVSEDCFVGSSKLRMVQLGVADFAVNLHDSTFARLFGSLTNLKTLYFEASGLRNFTRSTFNQLRGLSKLILNRNKILEIPDGAFDDLVNLTYLDLSNNQLSRVSESTFSPATRNRLQRLDLSHNSFLCDCDLRWFQNWLVTSPALFKKSFSEYTCSNLHGMPVKNFHVPDQSCLLSRETSKATVACMLLFVFLILGVSLIYHHRWHIRLRLAFRGHSDLLRRRLANNAFKYDVFLSSAEEDEDWVLRHLLPYLEGDLGLRACFHQRDFRPGKNILNNIVDSVKDSKKFLMVFSPHFARSQWCQFELDLCLGHVMDYGDALLVVVMGDMTSRHVTSTMTAVLKTTTYIQWPQCPDVRASFWRRMQLALRDITVGHF